MAVTFLTGSGVVGVGSKQDGQFNAMEYAHDGVTVWTDKTGPEYGNHSRLNGLVYIDKHTQPDTGSGEWCLDGLMKDHYGTLTASDIVRSIAALYQTGDAHVAVYDFDRAEMLVAYGANSIIAFAFMQLHYATPRIQRNILVV